jgi:hypothetical protein
MPTAKKKSTERGKKGLKNENTRKGMARPRNLRIYLDDLRIPPKGWKRAYTPAQVIWHLKRQNVSALSLDYDLGLGVPTGITVLSWLEERVHDDPTFRIPEIRIHSANPAGIAMMRAAAHNIYRLKREYGTRP